MKLLMAAALAALSLTSVKSEASAVLINSTCELGNCSAPDSIAPGTSLEIPFDFTTTLANTDSYRLTGNIVETYNTDLSFGFGPIDLGVTYEGNANGTSSGNDVLATQWLVNLNSPRNLPAEAEERLLGVFGPGLGNASSATASASIGSTQAPFLGPATPPGAFDIELPFSANIRQGNNLVDYNYTLTFGEGSSVGSTIGINTTTLPPSPVPEPSSLVLLGTGLATAAGAFRKRLSR